MKLIDILKEIMIERNLNQTTFAKLIGVKQSQVSEWLNGKSKPSYDSLVNICRNLDISGDYILGLNDKI